jgi:hypothetical protein
MSELLEKAKEIFKNHIAEGKTENQAAQAAFLGVRKGLSRAWHWDEQRLGTGSRAWYQSPLGIILGVAEEKFGFHSAKWARTKSSIEDLKKVQEKILAVLR